MGQDQLFIGIDSGTQGTKAVVFSRGKGEIIAEAYAPHDIIENSRGGREQDPEWWMTACDMVLSRVVRVPTVDRRQIKGLAVAKGQDRRRVAAALLAEAAKGEDQMRDRFFVNIEDSDTDIIGLLADHGWAEDLAQFEMVFTLKEGA